VGERDRDVEDVDDVLAQACRGQLQELGGVADRWLPLDERVRRVDAELGLGRARRSASPQPGELLAHEVLTTGLRGGRLTITLDSLQHVGRVTALERFDDAVVHLPRVGADLVEEPPVVRDDCQPSRSGRPPRLHVLREPHDALEIEVVGGLVEEHDVVLAHEHLGQRDATTLTTAERADPAVPRDVRQQAGDDVADARIAGPLVLSPVCHDGGRHDQLRLQPVGLVEEADPQVTPPRDPAVVGLDVTGQHTQQRRLAVTVATHHADAIAVGEAEAHAVEDLARRERETQRLPAEKRRH
jgi:hypothetical protein